MSPTGLARRMRCVSALACCLTGFALTAESGAQATSAALSGIVMSEAGEPLADVALSIGQSDATARTDAAGRFEFPAVPWGQVRLRVRALGFAPKDTLLLLQSGRAYSVRVQLAKFIPQLDTVRVQQTLAYGKPARYQHTGRFDDFYERRARRPGMFFTREEIERSPANKVSELISSGAGITLTFRFTGRGWEPNLRVARCTAAGGTTRLPPDKVLALYVDGQRVGLDFLENLATSEIETLEVYRGPSQLPLEAMGDACAAVFLTTRYGPGSVLTGNR
jgi:carboxypeptidase family protein/TonB-dependent receptor-like protein